MAMQTDTDRQPRAIVEHFRSTGYEGREAWISALDAVVGARVVAIRQLEASASRPACTWRDEVDDEIGLWGFTRDCLLENLESFVRIVEATIPQDLGAGEQNGSTPFAAAWRAVRRTLGQLRNGAATNDSFGEVAIRLLVGVMVLRQIADAEARGEAVDQTYFSASSTNVHPELLPGLLAKLGSTRIDLTVPVLLPELTRRLEAWSRNGPADGN
jgi:hypothetical protein